MSGFLPEHFELEGLIDAAVSSSQHGYMKPHPSIFEAALSLAGVRAEDAVMVGDSLTHDIEGAGQLGCGGCWCGGRRTSAGPRGERCGRQRGAAGIRSLTGAGQPCSEP